MSGSSEQPIVMDVQRAVRTEDECLDISKNNQLQSPLLRLPPELRNRIYKYALGGKKLRPAGFIHRIKYEQNGRVTPPNFVALLSVCRQIYAEARLYPFLLNTFEFINTEVEHIDEFAVFLTTQQQQSVKSVTMGIVEENRDGGGSWWYTDNKPVWWVVAHGIPDARKDLRDMFPCVEKLIIENHYLVPTREEDKKIDASIFQKIILREEVPFDTEFAICNCKDTLEEKHHASLEKMLNAKDKRPLHCCGDME
ncbi:unnamed protein product [Periconia digitata]|uniref:Uncharacterized protein n=1 Tax=Periconia digitata TaxID=1303443 RepID=A0A9W4U6I5_9PLEO|nr:unnamed protein product [Periconia digitata]